MSFWSVKCLEIVCSSISYVGPRFTACSTEVGLRKTLLFRSWEIVEVETLLFAKIQLSELRRFHNEHLIRWESERIKCCVNGAFKIWAVNLCELVFNILINLIQQKSLLTAKIWEIDIHPASDCSCEISLTLSSSHKHYLGLRAISISQKLGQLFLERLQINCFHLWLINLNI